MKFILLIINSCLFLVSVFGQTKALDSPLLVHQDSIKHPWYAAIEVLGQNVITNRFNNIVGPPPDGFSDVSLESWESNIKGGLTWDWNQFGVNYLGHPYQGALYYSSPRSLGMTFWESAPYAFLGSVTWEYLGETHPPSGNDMVNTTMGGIFLGEILHRLSDLVLDGKALGFERVWRESLGFVISPIRGFNRLVTGKMKQYEPNANFKKPRLESNIAIGFNYLTQDLNNYDGAEGVPMISYNLLYGNPFDKEVRFRPYDFFLINADLRFSKIDSTNLPSMMLMGYGNIMLKNISTEEDKASKAFGIFQIYDYINLPIIELGDMSLSGGILYSTPISDKTRFRMIAQVGPSILAGSNSEVVDVTEFSDNPTDSRDYIMGPGTLAKVDFAIDHPTWGWVSVRYSWWHIWVASGPKGQENLNVLVGKYQFPIYKSVHLGIQYTRYDRNSQYDEYEDINKFLHDARGFVAFKFN